MIKTTKNIKKQVFENVLWKFSERFSSQFISLIVSVILARILSPEDYGIVGIVTIFFSFASIIVSSGLNIALIQKHDADSEDYSSVLFLSIFLSIILYVVLYFSAPVIAIKFSQPILVSVTRVIGLVLPISAIKSIVYAYVSSTMQFKTFFFGTIGGILISAGIGIYMAVRGFGVWALVAQQMINIVSDTIILLFLTRMPLVFRISFVKLKRLFKFGWKILLTSIIGKLFIEISPIFVGLKYSSADLAHYSKGRSFPNFLSSTITSTLAAVLFPVLVKYQNDKNALLRYTRLFIRLTSYVAFPLMLGFFAVSDTFILVVLTEKWLPAAPYLRIFCIATMFDMIHVGNCETIKAMGRSDIYLIMEIVKKSMYFVTIGLFLIFSKSPVILAIAYIICTFIAIIVNSIPNRTLIGYRYIDQIVDLLPNLIQAIVMCIIVYLVGKLEMNQSFLLVIQILVGIFVYIILSLGFRNVSMKYLYNYLKYGN